MTNQLKFRSMSVLAILLSALTPCVVTAQQAEISDRNKARGIFQVTLTRFLLDHDRAKARVGFLAAIEQDPTYALPRYNLAVLAEADENWNDAIKWFEDFLRLDKDSNYASKAREEVAKLKQIRELDRTPEGRRRRRYDDAIARATVFLNAGLLRESVSEAALAAQIDDSRWEAYALAATALSQQELYDDAIEFLGRAITHSPQMVKTKLQSALEFCRQKKKTR